VTESMSSVAFRGRLRPERSGLRLYMTVEPAPFPLQSHLGMAINAPATGRGRAEVEVIPDLLNPNGVLHGAVLFAMVDTAMGAATMSMLDEGQGCASIELHIRFLRPVSAGRVVGEVEVLRCGRRVVQLQGQVVNDSDEVVATASGSFAVIHPNG
jgi:acyl-CoA thioesterase